MSRKLLPLALAAALAACSHGPSAPVVAQNDIAGIGPRPHFFGRHAWDLEQSRAAQTSASASAPVAPVTPPAAAPAMAVATPPTVPPTPVVTAEALPLPPALTQTAGIPVVPAPPAPPAQVATVQPAPPPPVPAPPAPPSAAKPADKSFFSFLPPLKRANLSPVQPPPPVMAGGYAPARDRKAVEAAAAFAVHESPGYEFKGIQSAAAQVVAGTNYSLCLYVRQIAHEANPFHRRIVAATVFQGLDGHYELTGWYEVESCHPGT